MKYQTNTEYNKRKAALYKNGSSAPLYDRWPEDPVSKLQWMLVEQRRLATKLLKTKAESDWLVYAEKRIKELRHEVSVS